MKAKTILLVEDNPSDAALARRAFGKAGVGNLLTVDDGEDALDYLFATGRHASRAPGLPDLILLDLNLPRVDGLSALRRLRADPRTRYIPVVVLTSSIELRDVAESYAAGANSYIRKPVDFERFVTAVNQIAGYWLRLNERPVAEAK